MADKKNNPVPGLLVLFMLGVFLTPYLSSCGKGGQASAVGLNTQLEVLNLSPDVHPINLYLHFIKQNNFPYYYPTSSGYFFLNSIDTPLQVRSASVTTQNLISISEPGFKSNSKYTLFVTGQYSTDSTVVALLTRDDSTAIPAIGFGKIRFINLAIPNTPLDVVANGGTAFRNIGFDSISPYVQIPVGNYKFQLNPTAKPGSVLTTTLSTTTIQDGRLYTLYSYGIVGRTDTSAFNTGLLINR
jgi:Domain of unknown function (DUF4397)